MQKQFRHTETFTHQLNSYITYYYYHFYVAIYSVYTCSNGALYAPMAHSMCHIVQWIGIRENEYESRIHRHNVLMLIRLLFIRKKLYHSVLSDIFFYPVAIFLAHSMYNEMKKKNQFKRWRIKNVPYCHAWNFHTTQCICTRVRFYEYNNIIQGTCRWKYATETQHAVTPIFFEIFTSISYIFLYYSIPIYIYIYHLLRGHSTEWWKNVHHRNGPHICICISSYG